jgi:hypothetical protein
VLASMHDQILSGRVLNSDVVNIHNNRSASKAHFSFCLRGAERPERVQRRNAKGIAPYGAPHAYRAVGCTHPKSSGPYAGASSTWRASRAHAGCPSTAEMVTPFGFRST